MSLRKENVPEHLFGRLTAARRQKNLLVNVADTSTIGEKFKRGFYAIFFFAFNCTKVCEELVPKQLLCGFGVDTIYSIFTCR